MNELHDGLSAPTIRPGGLPPAPPERGFAHQDLWGERVPVVGMVHLLPLPGSPRWGGSMDEVVTRASREANTLAEEGVDGVLVENFGDAPFYPDRVPAETVAAMAVVVREVVRSTPLKVGVNVLRNDAMAAISIAVGAGARFIRVNVHTGSMFTDQGLLSGKAFQTLRRRNALGPSVQILADIMVKHATPPPGLTLATAARDSWFRGLADGIVLTGPETGISVDAVSIQKVRDALPPDAKVWIGSGAASDNVVKFLEAVDGIIVGSALQTGGLAGAGVEAPRIREFMKALGRG